MDTTLEIAARIGGAALVGIVLGLNRWLHHKSAGVKTHALVAVGAATAVLCGQPGSLQQPLPVPELEAASRILQGLLAGIGFLGAGVIIHNARGRRIQGLTTAASIWATTVIGAAFGIGRFSLAWVAVTALVGVLIIGNGLERWLARALGHDTARTENGEGSRNGESVEP
jgi:putative Mg2+ transporter-C (MgtC) family protein